MDFHVGVTKRTKGTSNNPVLFSRTTKPAQDLFKTDGEDFAQELDIALCSGVYMDPYVDTRGTVKKPGQLVCGHGG